MSNRDLTYIAACSLKDLQKMGQLLTQVAGHTLVIIEHEDQVYALDNRCPHMGFPLNKGSVQDGILTCLWHNARFDLCSGGTFDLFADDVRIYPTKVEKGQVWVDPRPQRDEIAYQKARLQDGLEQNIRLVMAKSLISLLDQEVPAAELLKIGGLFGAQQRQAGWRDGLTIMTAMGNLLPYLDKNDQALALYHGMLHVANNVSGQEPHFDLAPLPKDDLDLQRLKAWLRQFAELRDRDGVERLILTALQKGTKDQELADMLFAAVTDHYYLDTGHSIDFINKAFELLDIIGWETASQILPSLVPGITASVRMEERSAWRHPIDLVAILGPIFEQLCSGALIKDVHHKNPLSAAAFEALLGRLLSDDPQDIALSLAEALQAGAGLSDIALVVSYASALRVARFHTANEFGDWISVLHGLTSANATYQLLKRSPSLSGARAIWHSAMHLYLNRFFNQPAARLPQKETQTIQAQDQATLLQDLHQLTDQRQQVEEAAKVTYAYLAADYSPQDLIAVLAKILLREDGEFHAYQMLEAGVQLYHEMAPLYPEQAPYALVAVARYLAGHAPTDRATTQTYRIAQRLHAGEALDV